MVYTSSTRSKDYCTSVLERLLSDEPIDMSPDAVALNGAMSSTDNADMNTISLGYLLK